MKYYSEGKLFDTAEEAEAYELKIKEKEEAKKKKEEEKQKRVDELNELWNQYMEKADKFYKDYGYYAFDSMPLSLDLFNSLYKILH